MSDPSRRINRSPNLSAQIYAELTRQIANGDFAPGERIVVDRVAEQLGVSQTPVREAIARLIHEGLVEEEATKRLRLIPLTDDYVFDTFVVRGALEGLAAELAATRIGEEQLAALEQAVVAAGQALERGDHSIYIESDQLLHATILGAADNMVLTRELHALQSHIDYIRGVSQRTTGDHLRQSQAEHQVIVAALRQRDATAARLAIETHIRSAGRRIVALT